MAAKGELINTEADAEAMGRSNTETVPTPGAQSVSVVDGKLDPADQKYYKAVPVTTMLEPESQGQDEQGFYGNKGDNWGKEKSPDSFKS